MNFWGFLLLMFIGFKLAGLITWPWIMVLAPLWLPLVIIFAFGVMWVVLAVLACIIATILALFK